MRISSLWKGLFQECWWDGLFQQVEYLEKCLDESRIFVGRVFWAMLQTYWVGEGCIGTLMGVMHHYHY